MSYSTTIRPQTLAELRSSGWQSKTVKQEIHDNFLTRLQNGEELYPGIVGYDDTVIPDLQTALLSRHNILLLGLRGQAKTRIARLMIELLDEYVPYVSGSELFDDPMAPISWFARDTISRLGDDTPVSWLPRAERYTEKLATPDVTVADLIGGYGAWDR